jgi:hypothetical protein
VRKDGKFVVREIKYEKLATRGLKAGRQAGERLFLE